MVSKDNNPIVFDIQHTFLQIVTVHTQFPARIALVNAAIEEGFLALDGYLR